MVKYNPVWEKFGTQQEIKLLPIISKYFNEEIKHHTNKFDKFDYQSLTTNYELKSRTNTYKKYPTTYLPKTKLYLLDNKKTIFIFNFLDGIYYIDYGENKDLIDNCYENTITLTRGVNKGERRVNKNIPIKFLKKLEQ